ncbi:hypothetical protein [Bacteroides faecis]|uniref:hypothetical protein n=1 Tax=Bacteroides faecis TaxID=674529 RepID=UPI0039C88C83
MKSPAEKERKESAPRRAYSPGEIIARKYEPLPWGPGGAVRSAVRTLMNCGLSAASRPVARVLS